MTVEALERWLGEQLAARCGAPRDGFDARRRFRDYGLTSAQATAMLAELGRRLGRRLRVTLVWEHPTPRALAAHLVASLVASGAASGAGGADAEPAAHTASTHQPGRSVTSEPIAIVGMACRFPGAPDPARFWQLLLDGVDSITEVPPARWDVNRYYSSDKRAPGMMSTRFGGFLDQAHIDSFDAGFFGISPREAVQVDPRQRLALELSWEALEDAGIGPIGLRGTDTGVFMGAMWSDYEKVPGAGIEAITMHSATGQDSSVIAGRVAYFLGLQGPCMVVNTACSSSLVAVHLACASLLGGEAELALAGGVNCLLAPHATVAMAKFGGMAPDGRCKPFDARADGYVRAEGGGVVVLKRLSAAIRDGDPVYCVIRGSAVNNDGFSNGLTAPSPRAQRAVLQAAYARAGVAPERVHYVEAHGTGTPLGDPIEAGALGAVLGVGRGERGPLLIGSVKSNIGHLEAAAGIAGLIKTVLAMAHRELPGTLHFTAPNPEIPFAELGLAVTGERMPWPLPDEPPLAGVSGFGFSGTNCHVVLQGMEAAGARAGAAAAEPRGAGVIFVFSGNGAQWPGMARDLLIGEPVFRAAVAACDRALERVTAASHFGAAGPENQPGSASLVGDSAKKPSQNLLRDPMAALGHSEGAHIPGVCTAKVLTPPCPWPRGSIDRDDFGMVS